MEKFNLPALSIIREPKNEEIQFNIMANWSLRSNFQKKIILCKKAYDLRG